MCSVCFGRQTYLSSVHGFASRFNLDSSEKLWMFWTQSYTLPNDVWFAGILCSGLYVSFSTADKSCSNFNLIKKFWVPEFHHHNAFVDHGKHDQDM